MMITDVSGKSPPTYSYFGDLLGVLQMGHVGVAQRVGRQPGWQPERVPVGDEPGVDLAGLIRPPRSVTHSAGWSSHPNRGRMPST
jgi:hypothetical protein